MLSLDFADAEGELREVQLASDADPEEFFRQESFRSLCALAVESLRERYATTGRERQFVLFERYDLVSPEQRERPTYAQLADGLGLTVTQVTNQLAAVRREFRRCVLEQLRAVSGTEGEFTLPDGRVYYAMKLVRGRALGDIVSSATPLAERLRIFRRICEPVAFAHAHGSVHRDLKPQNIMVGEFGEVVVVADVRVGTT